jgi:phosphonoacetaldehyde hydrolase
LKRDGIRMVILDWAGTTVDHGSMAPIAALQNLFGRRGIQLSVEDARRDMGLLKSDHISAILALPSVEAQWLDAVGRKPAPADVDSLFEEFRPLQQAVLAQHSQLIDGVAAVSQQWQQSGIRIGSTTGYTREMLTPILAEAAAGGYRPDASVCPEEVGAGRPAPWMVARNAQLLDSYPPSACVKIGDTVSDIEEGINAGMWTIGITRTGNLVGCDSATWHLLPAAEQKERLAGAEQKLYDAGADFVAEDLPACNRLLQEIEKRLGARGVRKI